MFTPHYLAHPNPHTPLRRFLVAAMDSQGGVDAGGQKAVVSQALQAVLEQSDTRNLIDQISDVSTQHAELIANSDSLLILNYSIFPPVSTN